MIRVTFEFPDVHAAIRALTDTLTSPPAPDIHVEPVPVLPTPDAPRKKSGRKAKAKTVEPQPNEERIEAHLAAKAAGPLTAEDARGALAKVNEAQGLAAATAVVAKLGYVRFSEIPKEKYEKLVEACNKALAG